jgi:hypothetical protein
MTIPGEGQPQSASSQAITALVLSILGIVCCGILAPVGWYLGNQEQKAIREGRSPSAGQGFAQAAVIIGIIGTILMVFTLLWIFFWGGMAILSGFMGR